GQLGELRAPPVEVRGRDDLYRDLDEIRRVLVRVVATEDQVSSSGQHEAELAGGRAAVAPLLGGRGCRGLGRWGDGGGHRRLLRRSWVDVACLCRLVFHR